MAQATHLDVIIHILTFLPSSHKAAVAKLVCKAAHSAFKEYNSISIASCGDLPSECLVDALRHLQQSEQDGPQQRLMEAVARQGDLPRLQLLYDHGCKWDRPVYKSAAAGGHLNVLQWVKAQNPLFSLDYNACEAAADGGHLAVLQWLASQNVPFNNMHEISWLCQAAAHRGHLQVLQWLTAQNPMSSSDHESNRLACQAAAEGGHLEVLQWLEAHYPYCSWIDCLCIAAVQSDHLHVLRWLRTRSPLYRWSADNC